MRSTVAAHKTITCGELGRANIGQTVTLQGWLNRRRDQGHLIFLDIRDRWGITQVVVNQESAPEAHTVAENIRNEYVLAATGTGSGKTEIFLLSILGSLAEECALGQSVTKLTGCRALILYPMNALVSDQLVHRFHER